MLTILLKLTFRERWQFATMLMTAVETKTSKAAQGGNEGAGEYEREEGHALSSLVAGCTLLILHFTRYRRFTEKYSITHVTSSVATLRRFNSFEMSGCNKL